MTRVRRTLKANCTYVYVSNIDDGDGWMDDHRSTNNKARSFSYLIVSYPSLIIHHRTQTYLPSIQNYEKEPTNLAYAHV